MQIVKFSFIAVITFVMIVLSGSFFTDPPSAQAVWSEGFVTKATWSDRYNRIEINGKTFTFMPEIGITFPTTSRPKVSGNELASLIQKIPVKQPVRFKIQGYRIYEIIVEK